MNKKHYLIAIIAALVASSSMIGITTARYISLQRTIYALNWDFSHSNNSLRVIRLTKAYSRYLSQQGIGSMRSEAFSDVQPNIGKFSVDVYGNSDSFLKSGILELFIYRIGNRLLDPTNEDVGGNQGYGKSGDELNCAEQPDDETGGQEGGESGVADNSTADTNSETEPDCASQYYKNCLADSGYDFYADQLLLLRANPENLPQEYVQQLKKIFQEQSDLIFDLCLPLLKSPRPELDPSGDPYYNCLISSGYFQLMNQSRMMLSESEFTQSQTEDGLPREPKPEIQPAQNNNIDKTNDIINAYKDRYKQISDSCKVLLNNR